MAQTTYTSIQSGNWDDPSIWSPTPPPSTYPGSAANDEVVIATGHTVTLNVSPPNTLTSVTVNSGGTLRYGSSASRTLRARDVTVNSGGTIDLESGFFLSHIMLLEPLSTDPANVATTFLNNGTVNLVANTNVTCGIDFLRSTKGPQELKGTGTFNLATVSMINQSTSPPPSDFAPLPETDATQIIGQPGGSAITMQSLAIENRVGQVRGSASFFSPIYREDNPTEVYVPLTISGQLALQTGVLILNRADGASLTHSVGSIEIGSGNSIAVSSGNDFRHNTGIALVSATNATTTLTVTGNVSAPNLSHTDEGVVIVLVAPASGTGTNDASTSGATLTVNGNFNLSGALGLRG